MAHNEDCRTAVFGKTERTVGWEENGTPDEQSPVRHCNEETRRNRYAATKFGGPFFYPR